MSSDWRRCNRRRRTTDEGETAALHSTARMAAVQRATAALDSGEGEAVAGSSATAAGGSATLSGGYWRRKQRRRCNSAALQSTAAMSGDAGGWLLQLDGDDRQLAHGGAAPIGDDGGEAGEGRLAAARLGKATAAPIGRRTTGWGTSGGDRSAKKKKKEKKKKKKKKKKKEGERTKKDKVSTAEISLGLFNGPIPKRIGLRTQNT
ncbi:unnamed protein product [Cuscuta campestris]|uniref:Uncharacterized protein n=1 Tax=Cuscuta campestris TaxID=132261 RepID=A0A484L2I8_9ASTE|nr:unnamed protein product [Cuscuta campestris]